MKRIVLTLIALLSVILFSGISYASESDGTILTGSSMSKICKNVSCSSFGTINWRPTLNANTTGATAVHISDVGITGWLWGDEIGWVNMQPTGSGVTIATTTGVVSGYAYANAGAWINFAPTTVFGGTTVGVTINSTGQFAGWAYVSGINGGWMKFDCSSGATCIQTDWRSVPNRSPVPIVITPSFIPHGTSGSITVPSTSSTTNPFYPPIVVTNPVPEYVRSGSGTYVDSNGQSGVTPQYTSTSSGFYTPKQYDKPGSKPLVLLPTAPCGFWDSLSCQLPLKILLILCSILALFIAQRFTLLLR